ncbi:MAG TPA: carboxypeptidase-like regulatory domain-containing protein [Kofleriaceae bacterium]|nr:carboxypeptidase-like regulatory domain-containing protein [Kofleriaceae bacterium]
MVYLLAALLGGEARPPALRDAGAERAAAPVERERPALEPLRGTGTETLLGFIVDAAGGPIDGVWVTADPEVDAAGGDRAGDVGPTGARERAVVAESGADGAFALVGLAAGRYRLRVEGAGVLGAEVRFVEAPATAVRIVVSREVAVEGRVLAPDGRGAAGVAVRLTRGAQPLEAISDAAGRFRFTGLPEGRYRAYAFAGEQASAAVAADRMGAGPFAPIDLVLAPAAVLDGRVVNAVSGAGVVADVALVSDDPDQPPRTARSNAAGQFRIEGVPFGRWTADAHAPGYLSADAIRFLAASDYAPVIQLEPGAAVSGRVVDADGRPLEGATVLARGQGADGAGQEISEATLARPALSAADEPSGLESWKGGTTATGLKFIPRGELGVVVGPLPYPPPPGAGALRVAAPLAAAPAGLPPLPVDPAVASRLTTGPDGRFRIAGIPPGRYQVWAHKDGFADGATAPFEVELGRVVDDLELPLGAGLTLDGQVVDDRGAAVAGATVAARPRAGGEPTVATTGADGRYQLGPLAGELRLSVTAVGYGGASRDLSAPRVARTSLRRQEDFLLARADAELEGRVLDATGAAVAGATLHVVAPGLTGVAPSVTDAAGRFRITGVPVGRHRVRLEHPQYPPLEAELRTGVGNQLELPLGGGVEVTVRDRSTGAALRAARVTATSAAAPQREATTGADGRAEIPGLPAGSWTLQASAPGYAAAGVTVQVAAGRRLGEITARDVLLDLTRAATLAGVVRDRNGDRVAGAEVSVDGAPARATTDGQGRFRMTDAPSGPVTLLVRKGARRGSLRLDLAPGDELVTLELRLE